MLLPFSAPVLVAGLVLFFAFRYLFPKNYVIDPFIKRIYKGKPYSSASLDVVSLPDGIDFDSVYALQIVVERVTGKHSFLSYELNLVMKDATRECLVDHSGYKKLREDADLLAGVLGVPLWDAVELQKRDVG